MGPALPGSAGRSHGIEARIEVETDTESTAADPDSTAEPAGRRRSPVVAATLSFLWPGLGQLFLGRRGWAVLFALPTAALAVWVVAQVSHGAWWIGASMLDESYALTVAVLVVLAGLLRVASTTHAFLSAPPARRFRVLQAGVVAGLLAATVGTHAYVAADAWLLHQADLSIAANNDLFAADVFRSPSASPTIAPTPIPTPTPIDTSAFAPAGTVGPSAAPPSPTPNPNRITFLVVGVDFMTGRSHSLTDTLMVVSLDTSTGKVAIVSVPRDTANFDLYYGGWVSPGFKINELLSSVSRGSLASPDPPMTTLAKEIGFLVGIPVDYYAAIDLDGFTKMVDAIGGVDVYNPRAIDDPFTGTEIPAGPVHLDGPTALKFVRSREGAGDSDYTRAGRQQLVLVALERKVASPAVLPHLSTLISLAGQTIATDFPLKNARDYVTAARGISSVSQCVLGPPYSYHPATWTTGGTWTSRLDLARVANLSVAFFGADSRYYGLPGVVAAACGQ